MDNAVKTIHRLDFEATPFEYDQSMIRFRIGTCEGVYGVDKDGYYILAISNSDPGNGHLDDVFQWFEHSAKRDKKALKVIEIWNEGFYHHLVNKRKFKPIDPMNVIKRFDIKSRLRP